MNIIFPLIAVAAALLASSAVAQNTSTNRLDDATMRQLLLGTWRRVEHPYHPNSTNTVTLSFTFHADGTYSNGVTSVVSGLTDSSTGSGYTTGDWEIQQGVLVSTVKRRSDTDMPAIGTGRHSTIEKLDDRQFVFKNSRNETLRFERAN